MAKQTFFSPIMPFAMRPETSNRPARYHSGHLDTEWQKNLIQRFQMPYEYAMKWELGDPFRFQAKTTGGLSWSLFLVSCRGKFIATIPYTSQAIVAGDLAGDGTQLYTYQYTYQDISTAAGVTIAPGTYYLLYQVGYTSTEIGRWISEPIEIAASFPDTLLFEYSNSFYKYGVPFADIPCRFRLRVEGYKSQMVPKSASTVYQDQSYDTVTLDFNPYRNWTLFLGQQGFGIPYWLIDKLNSILGLDNILIDGKQFTAAAANPAWTIDGPETTPLKAANVDVQEAFTFEDFTTVDPVLELYVSPGYPYAVSYVKIGPWILNTPGVITSSGDETTYVTTLNNALGAHELIGTITKVGSSIRYNNAAGEDYRTSSVGLFTTKLTWSFTPSVGPFSLSVGIQGAGLMNWGDGTLVEIASTDTQRTFSHTYGSASIYSVQLWTNNLAAFTISTTQPSGLSGLTGTVPANLRTMSVSKMTFASNTFDFGFVSPAAATIQGLQIFQCSLTAANNMPSYAFSKLKTINFSGNTLNQTVMNLLIQDVRNNAAPFSGSYPNILNGNLNVVQVPPQSLNSTGTAAKSTLVSMGWTVNP